MTHHEQIVKTLRYHFGEKDLCGIEIGTANGDSANAILLAMPNVKKLFTVDPWTHVPGSEFEASFPQEKLDLAKKIATERLSPYGDRCTILNMRSDYAFLSAEIVKARSFVGIDFVWIDGHHEYSQVAADVKNAMMVVREDGLVGGHDYGQVPDVARAVDELFGKENVNTGADFTWWVEVEKNIRS